MLWISPRCPVVCNYVFMGNGHIYLDIDAEVDEEVVYRNFSFNPKSDWRRLGRGYPLDICLSAVHSKYGTIYIGIVFIMEKFFLPSLSCSIRET